MQQPVGPTGGYIAYFGTFTVDEKAKTVTHHVEGNLNPDAVGKDQARDVTVDGDSMTLIHPLGADGKGGLSVNHFSRIK